MMKNVVVTGATSFIGFPLVKALLEKGYSVFAVVRPNSKSHQKLNSILSKYSKSNDTKLNKKANLLSYWLVDYLKMIEKEQSFDPHRLKKYKRGDILKVNLGFNIGHEEGGLHYTVVVSNTNANSSDLLTVVPLTSLKTNSKITILTLAQRFMIN